MSDQNPANPSSRPDPLADLNPAQREAAEFGVGGAGDDGPLLVIAGAGSGKTNTLAHRVAHLILNGADPQRMLLLTFSRRAAQEMERRVGSVLQRVMNLRGSQQAPSLPWAGTFHAIGAMKSASLATVAPGISEALIATAMGLLVAIPATIGYNTFHGRLSVLETRLVNFAGMFLNRVQRELNAHRAVSRAGQTE